MMNHNQLKINKASNNTSLYVLIVLAFGSVLALYYIIRYSGYWMEGTDTASITNYINYIYSNGTINPPEALYPHGFAYQTFATFLSYYVGITPLYIQTFILPFVGITLLIICALLFYRKVFPRNREAFLSVLFLLLQPDLLFVTLRGSHEKIIWPLVLLALVCIYNASDAHIEKTILFVSIFYLIIFVLSSTNVFFASSFIAAILIAYLFGEIYRLIIARSSTRSSSPHNKFVYVFLSSTVIVFTVMVYIYPNASLSFYALKTIYEKVSVLLIGFEPAGNPYGYISYGWIDTKVYFSLTIFTWLLICSSLLEWLLQTWQMFRQRIPFQLKTHFIWMLYAGFALQIFLGIIIDYSGAIAQNFQLRIIPGFVLLAIPFFTQFINRLAHQTRKKQVIYALVGALVFYSSIASVFKFTSEPLLSNRWGFYHPGESLSLKWIDSYSREQKIWVGYDDRLSSTYRLLYNAFSSNKNKFFSGQVNTDADTIYESQLERLRNKRIGLPDQDYHDLDVIYDNDIVRIYR